MNYENKTDEQLDMLKSKYHAILDSSYTELGKIHDEQYTRIIKTAVRRIKHGGLRLVK